MTTSDKSPDTSPDTDIDDLLETEVCMFISLAKEGGLEYRPAKILKKYVNEYADTCDTSYKRMGFARKLFANAKVFHSSFDAWAYAKLVLLSDRIEDTREVKMMHCHLTFSEFNDPHISLYIIWSPHGKENPTILFETEEEVFDECAQRQKETGDIHFVSKILRRKGDSE